ERIAADDARRDPLLDENLDCALLPFERGFADPGQPRIRGETHEQIIAQAGIGEKRLQAFDLHAGTPSQAPASPSVTACPLAIDRWMASTRATAAAPSWPVAESGASPRTASRTFSRRPA